MRLGFCRLDWTRLRVSEWGFGLRLRVCEREMWFGLYDFDCLWDWIALGCMVLIRPPPPLQVPCCTMVSGMAA